MSSKVSVIIPVFNYGRYVAEAIDSVLAQTYKDFEIIVVDDGSTDQTPNVVQRYGRAVTYIRQKNSGVAEARNRGVRESNGELIAFLDADDIWVAEKLAMQVAAMNANPDAGIVFTARTPLLREGKTRPHFPEYPRCPRSGWVLAYLLQGNFIPTSSTVVRRICFESAGIFRGEYTPCEDYDLWVRIARQFSVVYIDCPAVLYRIHSESLSSQESLRLKTWEIVRDGLARYSDVPEVAAFRRKILRANIILNSQLALEHNRLIEGLLSILWAFCYLPTSFDEWRFFCRSFRKLAQVCYRVSFGQAVSGTINICF